MDFSLRAVRQYFEGEVRTEDLCRVFGISERTVHRVLVRNGLMIRARKRPKPYRRFQRHRVDSLWQMDAYEFRIGGVGKIYVFTILDDRTQSLVMAWPTAATAPRRP